MKNPAASSGVSEKHELPILMKLLINTALLLHVVSYRGLIPMLTHSTGKISVRPKLSSPQLLLDVWTQSEDLPRRYTFDHRYQLRHAICRHRLHQKMNVVFVYPYLQKLYLIALLYPKTNISNDLIYGFIKHCLSIFRRKHHVIQQHRYIMTLMNILAHASTLRPKGRGINPVEIQNSDFLGRMTMGTRIKHVAICTENYDRMAEFYKTVFGMKKITNGMTDATGNYNPERGHISDGLIGYAPLQRQPGIGAGLDHFGFEGDDGPPVLEKLAE